MDNREKLYGTYLSLSDNPSIEEAFTFAYRAAENECKKQKDKEISELKDTIKAYEIGLSDAAADRDKAKTEIAELKAELKGLRKWNNG